MSSFLAFLLICSFTIAAPTNADDLFYADCPNNMNYTRGSAFQANLDALLSYLPGAAVASSGFAENITGAAPDTVYGLAQCRADVNASDCRTCLDASVQDMPSKCPGQKAALLIYDRCLIRHSNASFFGAVDGFYVYMSNSQNASQPQFTSTLGTLMGNLTQKAAYASPRMFAAGTAHVTPFVKLYGMAQCTRDLAQDDCNRCLSNAVTSIPNCCNERQGARIYLRSCSIRYELYPFYNEQGAEAAMSSPAPPPAGGPDVVPGSTGNKHTVRTTLLVAIPVAVTLVVVAPLVALFVFKRNRKQHKHAKIIANDRNGDEQEEIRSSESILYDLNTLRAATNNFSEENKLGEGGFGPVYKGVLEDGQEIAVKRLSTTSHQGQVEMKNEVFLVAKLQHKNLVRILGCCVQEHERLLVYEFLSNNSLDKIVFDPKRKHELGWERRRKIIEGIGRGLLYLHEDSRLTIIHRDLKASNILLDADMNPKISDFGLAKLFNVDSSVGNTSRIAGTYGYMSPEYALHGIFSAKSDVFSYGVLVLEIITGRRNTHVEGFEDLLSFVSSIRNYSFMCAAIWVPYPSECVDVLIAIVHVWRCWRHGNIGELLEGCPADGRQPQELLKCIHVGLLCVQEDPQLRPGMAAVIIMLNSRSITLPAPTMPAFAVDPGRAFVSVETLRSSIGHGGSMVAPRWSSINDDSVTDLEPR